METEIIKAVEFDAAGFAQAKAREMAEKFAEKPEEEVEEAPQEPTEAVEEEQPEVVEAPVTEEPTEAVATDSLEVAALKKELARVKAKLREPEVQETFATDLAEIKPTFEEDETVEVTSAEARLFTSWRDEALEELLTEHPEYSQDAKAWARFQAEYKDRVPELVYAKQNNVPVTKKLFKERLTRVHRAINDGTLQAKSDGKAELLKAQSAASIMASGSKKGEVMTSVKAPRRLFPKPSAGLDAWVSKKM